MLQNAVKKVTDTLMLSDLLKTPIGDVTSNSNRKSSKHEKENRQNFSIGSKKGIFHPSEIGIVSLSQPAKADNS
jgi:hypothetical protein